MREYSKISPQYWLGETGKQLRGHPEAQIVSLYLLTTPHANMLGLFYLPKMFIAHETGLPFEGACEGLARCIEVGFCHYDDKSETVWVVEMALHQVGELKPTDNRCSGIQNEYDKLPENLYLQGFYEKYASIFHMKSKRASKAPSKPLRSQEQEQEKEQEHLNKKEKSAYEESENPAPPPDPKPAEDIPAYAKTDTQQPYTDSRAMFEMHADWQPTDSIRGLLGRAGLPTDIAKLDQSRIGDFVNHWFGKPDRNTADSWNGLLVGWLKRTQHDKPKTATGQAQQPKPDQPAKPKYDDPSHRPFKRDEPSPGLSPGKLEELKQKARDMGIVV